MNNIKNRVSKGLGIISGIFNVLECLSFGSHYFKIALLLRRSLLISGTIFNSDIWYNLTDREIKEIGSLDSIFFSRLFGSAKTTSKESFYLETGELDIETEIKSRRILYLHNLLNRPQGQLIVTFLHSQILNPSKGDWIYQVTEDLRDFDLPMDLQYYENISKCKAKKIIKSKARIYAFNKFTSRQKSLSKLSKLKYDKLETQEYLIQKDITIEDKKTLFRWRTHMERFGENFRGGRESVPCPLYGEHRDSEIMSFKCETIKRIIKIETSYKEIFCQKISKTTVDTISKIAKFRNKQLELEKN